MTINSCIEAMINLELDAMVWEFENCPIKELSELYIPNDTETHVIVTKPINDYMAFRLQWTKDITERGPQPTILRLNEEYYCYIIYTDDIEYIKDRKASMEQFVRNDNSSSDDLPF